MKQKIQIGDSENLKKIFAKNQEMINALKKLSKKISQDNLNQENILKDKTKSGDDIGLIEQNQIDS